MPKHFNCIICNRRTKPKERRIISASVKKYIQEKILISNIADTDIICNKCKHKYYKAGPDVKSANKSVHISDPDYEPPCLSRRHSAMPSPPSVCLTIPGAPSTHSRCIICKKPGPKLIVISHHARFLAYIDGNILIRAGSRCCPVHINNCGNILPELLQKIPVSEQTLLNRTSITQLIQHMRLICQQQNEHFISFDKITDEDCRHLTGLSSAEFEDLCSHILDKVKSTPARSSRMSVGLFLFKLKSALSNRLLSTLFRISTSSVRRAISTVRKALMRSFVPLYLGLESVTREQVINQHTRPLAKSLFNVGENDMILVLDGTYIYIQKSDNFCFQRQSYSVHKCRPLVKPMVVVTTTGHFVTIMGPYIAKNNDASILNHMLKKNVEDIKCFLKEDDVIVIDRGFRDSVALLEKMGIRAAMPTFLKKGQKQMSVEDANMSRIVTKIRWVVESANSRIKRFKYLDRVLPTSQIPYIGDFVRIVCAVANKYFPPLSGSATEQEDAALANRMRELSTEVNTLQHFVEDNHLDRRTTKWTSIDESDLENFPVLTDEQLRSLTCGVYQLKLSSSYIQEYIEGDCEMHIHKEDNSLLCVRIQSRHISSKKYMLWIKYNNDTITAWYCKCRAGARIVGVCSHIAAVIWYLSSARHDPSRQSFGVRYWGQYLTDANDLPEEIDISDTGSVSSSATEE